MVIAPVFLCAGAALTAAAAAVAGLNHVSDTMDEKIRGMPAGLQKGVAALGSQFVYLAKAPIDYYAGNFSKTKFNASSGFLARGLPEAIQLLREMASTLTTTGSTALGGPAFQDSNFLSVFNKEQSLQDAQQVFSHTVHALRLWAQVPLNLYTEIQKGQMQSTDPNVRKATEASMQITNQISNFLTSFEFCIRNANPVAFGT